MLCS
jgi:DNA replication protein DnaC